jgi:hypothetical protein
LNASWYDLVLDVSIRENVGALLATPGADYRRTQVGASAATTADAKG